MTTHAMVAHVVHGRLESGVKLTKQGDLVPSDIDVGMMVGCFGGRTHRVHEGECRREIARGHRGGQRVVLSLPLNVLLGQ